MIKNFFLIAIRNISKNKVVTFINITGLAIGLAASLLILLWIQNELSYEKFNLNAENIYRVEEDQFYSGERYHVTVTPHPSGPVWMEKIPEIKEQTRVNRLPRLLFREGEKAFFETSIAGVDSGMFRMFTMSFLLGDPMSALNTPHSIVLTEKLAKKYFGNTDPLGRSLTVDNKYQFMVTGVMKDLPQNSRFNFEGLIPYSFLEEAGAISTSWGIYPAFYLSSFKPVTVLKGDNVSGKGSRRLRQVLVVLQFTLSILIAISAIFMYMQLIFLQEKELGFDKDHLICIPMARNMKPRYYALKRELQKETMIQGVTASIQNPVMLGSNAGGAMWEGKDPEKQVLIGTNGICPG